MESDKRSRRSSEASIRVKSEPTALELYTLLRSIIKRLDVMESGLCKRVDAIEASVALADKRITELERTVSTLQEQFGDLKNNNRKAHAPNELPSTNVPLIQLDAPTGKPKLSGGIS